LTTLSALPDRPLHARPPTTVFSGILGFLSWLFCAGCLVFMTLGLGPDLVADWRVRDAALPVRSGHLARGKCSTKLFVHICEATLTAPGPAGAQPLRRNVDFAFGSFTLGDFSAMVVADPAQPALLTTDLALDHFWDRVVTLALAIALFAGIVAMGLVGLVRTRRDRALWRATPSVFVPLHLTKIVRSRTSAAWTVQAKDGKAAQWTVPPRSRPFALGSDGMVLGLRRQVDGAVMPLDAALRWVDLTAAERAVAALLD